jgi:PAS domain S-box-containing protein
LVVFLFAFAAIVTAALALISWKNRESPVARCYTLLFAAATLWNIGDVGEFLSVSSTAKFMFVCVEYPGMVAVPVAWFLIVLYYTGHFQYITRKTVPLLITIPVLTVIAVFTNPFHHLYYTGITSLLENGIFVGVYMHGPLFWSFITYSYALSIFGIFIILSRIVWAHTIYRHQMVLLLVACAFPLIANILYVSRLGPWPYVDLAPILFTISGIIAAYGINRHRLLSFIPVAYSRVFYTITDGVIVLDNRGDICDVNPAGQAILSQEPELLIGQQIDRFLPPELRFAAIAQLREDPKLPLVQEITVVPAGVPRYYEASCSVFDAGFPGKKNYLILLRDVTSRRQAQSALTDAHKKINLMASITRHDILNQIMALDCFVELNSESHPTPEQAEYIEKEKLIIAKIQEQIEFTREYQKLGAEAAQWQDAREAIERAGKLAEPGGIRIVNDVSPVEIFADPMLEKVFFNLIDNAVKYGGTITRITFSGERDGAQYRIVCEDDGVGIPDEDREKLFTRGFGKHTGLGLFLSREILSITGITIMETGKYGIGARFEILVPPNEWRLVYAQVEQPD